MKLLLLLELAGLLAFGSLIFPSIKYVAEGNPLPEIEKPKETISIIEAASIDFEGMNVKLYYNSLSGFSYSDPNSQWERQKTPVCNADKTKCLYADFYQQFELKQNDELLEPDVIIPFHAEDISTDILIYFLDTSSDIQTKYTYMTADISRTCYEPQYCKAMQTTEPKDIYHLSKSWMTLSDTDRKRYLRYFDGLLYIGNNWSTLDPETGGSRHSGNDVRLSYYKTDFGKHLIMLDNSSDGRSFYELTDSQFIELMDIIGK